MDNLQHRSVASSLEFNSAEEIAENKSDEIPWRMKPIDRHGSSDCLLELKEDFKLPLSYVIDPSAVKHRSIPNYPREHSFSDVYARGNYRGHVHNTSRTSTDIPNIDYDVTQMFPKNLPSINMPSGLGAPHIAQCSESSNELDDPMSRHHHKDDENTRFWTVESRDVEMLSRENSYEHATSGVNHTRRTILHPRLPSKEECSLELATNSEFRIGNETLNGFSLVEEIHNQLPSGESVGYDSNTANFVQQNDSLRSSRNHGSYSNESPWEKLVKELQDENDGLTVTNQRQATFIRELLQTKANLESRLRLRDIEPGNALQYDNDLYATQLRTFEEDVKTERNEKELAIAENESLKIQLKVTRDELILAQRKLADLEGQIDRTVTERLYPSAHTRSTGDTTAILCEDDRIENSN